MSALDEVKKLDNAQIPQHVAIILDGNGRWAKKRHMPRNFGHKAGADAIENLCRPAWNMGIKYLTVYAFSTENWKRSVEEVTGIMTILRNFLITAVERANKDNMRVRVIGERSRLDKDIREAIERLEKGTAQNTGLQFTMALNYGGRDDITRAVRGLADDLRDGVIRPEDITEQLISSRLDTRELPDPDLLIRTSGELRISNFMPWQISYSEFYFCDTLWPDFNKDELAKAIIYYAKRDRRYGGVK